MPILALPIAVAAAFIPMYYLGVTSNIMSLGGIALAIGVLVDASIVMVENAYRHLSEPETDGAVVAYEDQPRVVIAAAKQVGRADLLLARDHHRLVRAGVPARGAGGPDVPAAGVHQDVRHGGGGAAVHHARAGADGACFIRGRKLRPESENPMSRFFTALYAPILRLALRWRWAALLLNFAVVPLTIPLLFLIGSEFMPPLYEGSLLYMPTSPPGLSITEATRLLQIQDKVLRQFPEVERVFGTVGRGTSSTDNSPMGMVNTTVTLKPREQWRAGHDARGAPGGDGRGAAVSRVPERVDAADPQPARHAARPGSRRRSASRSSVRISRSSSASVRRSSGRSRRCRRDAQRLRRARDAGLFHRHPDRPRGDRATRAH